MQSEAYHRAKAAVNTDRFRRAGYGKHKPTHRVGPLLPASLEQASVWLRGRTKIKLGVAHVLERIHKGLVVIRAFGRVHELKEG
jgi:hypothetical protein